MLLFHRLGPLKRKKCSKKTPNENLELVKMSKEIQIHSYILEKSLHEIETKSKRVNNIGKTFSVHLFNTSSFSERSAVVLTDDVLKST